MSSDMFYEQKENGNIAFNQKLI